MSNHQHDAIAAYLDRLRDQLRLPANQATPILAEAADHLLEAAAAMEAAGLPRRQAQQAAVERFGDPVALGRALSAQAVWAGARATARVAVGAVATAGAIYAAYSALLVRPSPAGSGVPVPVGDAALLHAGSAAFQVTIVAAVVGLYHAVAARHRAHPGDDAVTRVQRCTRAATWALGAAVTLTGAYELRRVGVATTTGSAAPVAGVAVVAVVVAVMAVAFVTALVRQRRFDTDLQVALPPPGATPAPVPAGSAMVAAPLTDRALLVVAGLLARSGRLPAVLRAWDFDRHPARLTTLAAAAAAAVVYVGSRAVGDETVPSALLGAVVEAAAVITGATLLAPHLGMRRQQAHP